jgi:DNA-binding MarR family transcriptional regulator
MISAVERVERELTLLVRRAQRMHLHHGDGLCALDRPAYTVLGRLHDDGPLHLSDLAAAFGLDLSTLSRQVAALCTAGFVRRERDPADRRAWLLTLTPEGRDAVHRTRALRRRILREVLASWPEGNVDALAELLEQFNADLSSHASTAATTACHAGQPWHVARI